ncbi:hypothetical protein AGMMS50233_11360 [Endomicrobiia bacterium]|nr:hypothetical protein AGMMS50233_11360 [Endomicrobiia bacterium]
MQIVVILLFKRLKVNFQEKDFKEEVRKKKRRERKEEVRKDKRREM